MVGGRSWFLRLKSGRLHGFEAFFDSLVERSDVIEDRFVEEEIMEVGVVVERLMVFFRLF
jgi:hypothetical protein